MSSFAPSLADSQREGVRVTRMEYPAGLAGVKLSLEQIAQRIREGALSPKVQGVAFDTLIKAGFNGRGQNAGSAYSRAQALLDFVRENTLYAPDPPGVEYVKSAEAMLCLAPGLCIRGGDCFPRGTKVRGAPTGWLSIEDVKSGDRIWGLDGWTTVLKQWRVGARSIDTLKLANSSDLRLSPEHHIFVREGNETVPWPVFQDPMGPMRTRAPALQKIRVRDAHAGMHMLRPDRYCALWCDNALPMCREQWLKIEQIARNGPEEECFDITTEDGFVYLPEHDVTVSNCDDQLVLLGSMIMGVGIPVQVLKQTFGVGDQEHVLLEAQDDSGNWFPLDPSGDMPAGYKAPASSEYRLDPSNPTMIGLHGVPDAEFVGVGALAGSNYVGFGDTTTTATTIWTPVNIALGLVAIGVLGGVAVGVAQKYGPTIKRKLKGRR